MYTRRPCVKLVWFDFVRIVWNTSLIATVPQTKQKTLQKLRVSHFQKKKTQQKHHEECAEYCPKISLTFSLNKGKNDAHRANLSCTPLPSSEIFVVCFLSYSSSRSYKTVLRTLLGCHLVVWICLFKTEPHVATAFEGECNFFACEPPRRDTRFVIAHKFSSEKKQSPYSNSRWCLPWTYGWTSKPNSVERYSQDECSNSLKQTAALRNMCCYTSTSTSTNEESVWPLQDIPCRNLSRTRSKRDQVLDLTCAFFIGACTDTTYSYTK